MSTGVVLACIAAVLYSLRALALRCRGRLCQTCPCHRQALHIGAITCPAPCSVLDLGSGSGRDCYVAAALVGESGSVTGVDMTPALLAVARKHAEQYCTQVWPSGSGVCWGGSKPRGAEMP